MSRETLKATKRDASGKSPVARRLRKTGQVPGILYRGGDSLPFQVDGLEVAAVLRHGSTLIDLDVDGTSHASVIKTYEVHPVKGTLQHIDLQEVRMDEMIKSTVGIVLVGESPGQKAGGVLSQAVHELNIQSTPLNIPDSIEVDISGVEMGGSLTLADITAGEGVEFLDDPGTQLVMVSVPRAAADDEVAEGEEGEGAEGEGGDAAADAGGDAGADAGGGE
jgi:large subunit ribosomal protein L25